MFLEYILLTLKVPHKCIEKPSVISSENSMKKLAQKIAMMAMSFGWVQGYAQNMGIGVTNPQFVLDVGGRMQVRSGGDAQNTAGIWFSNIGNTAKPAFLGMFSDNIVGIYGSGSNWGMLMNTNNGNVGIGTNPSTSTKLDVNGTIKATDITATDDITGKTLISTGDVIASGNFDIGLQYVVNTSTIAANTYSYFICLCPINKKVIGGGGGHNLTNPGQQYITINSSVPIYDGSGWLIRATNRNPNDSHILNIWAICAKVK
jgi:hypothetical protein